MAEARSEEEEENMRDTREQVVRRQPRSSGGRPGRRKPEHRLSQGPLSSIRAVIKRTSTRPTSVSETSRERDRERDRDRRRPEITILSAEPLTSVSWFPGASGGFPPPPPPAAQIWGSTIPPAIQPPPSYEEVIREKTQEQVLLPPLLPPPSLSFSSSSSSSCSSSSLSRPTSTITIATQTDTGSTPAPGDDGVQPRRPVRPPRPSFPSPPTSSHADDITTSLSALTSVSGDADLFSRLTPSTCSHTERSLAPPTAAGLERPRPRPRSKLNLQPVSGSEVQVQTLVKLRDDGLATLAARAVADPATRGGVSQGKYLQELLEAFSSDDWGFPERHSGSSGQSESEEDEEEDGEDMAALKARIQAFEQQVADESCGNADGKDAVSKRPEPRPRPRLQGQQAKSAPPTVAPKPKNFPQAPKPSSKVFWEDSGSAEAEPQLVRTVEKPTLAPKPQSPTETLLPSVSAPVPAPRPPPPKLTHSLSEASSSSSSTTNPRLPPRPAVAPRGNLDKSSPTLPPRPSVEVSSRAKAGPPAETQETANQTVREGSVRLSVATKPAAVTSPRRASAPTLAPKPTGAASQMSPDPNPLPAKPAGPVTPKPAAPAPAKPPAPAQRKNPVISVKAESSSADPPLPPRPSSVKLLPLRPPPIKSIPERPPPPAVTSTSTSAPPPSVASPAPGVLPTSQCSPSQTPPHPTCVTANQQQRVPKKGPPLPPRPKPGHPLYSSYTKQEVLIVLDDPSPAPPEDQTPASPVTSLSQCLLAMDTQPEPGVHQDSEGKPSLDLNLDLSQSQSILPVQPPEQKEQPDAAPVSGPRCVALFDYEGEEDDELTFSQGDVIALLELMGQEWGRGQIHGRVGIFPLNFTEVTEPPPPQSVTSPEETTKTALDTTVTETTSAPKTPQDLQTEEWEVALFDFPGQAADDLSFHKGALILVTEHVDAEWRRGRLEGREGLYPAAFTQPCQARPITEQQQTVGVAAKGAAKALFDFVAESEDEIMLKVGDIITEVEAVNEQWIVGVVGGRRGIVPKNYVSLL
ncbi:SH3 domain-containing 19-like [Solea senegalensis]|uniref:SH3 domain-containing 19-like n=1 Tax=Solea senegalensis TaxID=28829 RepID=A0AAV6QAE8_SOLSE|nr:SH3 domain-containing protein 19-like [Solea senegalensis]KAG7485395.1 SH3 domain-containing 19-like [Solea senegalensis]